jgi:uncharacterized protein (TIGR02118 family)
MVVRFGLLKRNERLSPEAFDMHWRDVHGPLAADLPGLRSYAHHVVRAKEPHAIRGDWDIDGISELHFDSVAAMDAAFATASGAEAKEDLSLFLDDVWLVVCERHTVVAPHDIDGAPVLKRMSLIRRKPEVSEAEFRHEWLEVHAAMMRQWPGVLGYHQNLVIDRLYRGQRATRDAVPVDGIVEIWFPGAEQAAATHATEIVRETMAHAREFLAEITPFTVGTRRIL